MDLYITDTALKVSRYLYCFTTPISHGVEKYLPRLWVTGISDAIVTVSIFTTPISHGVEKYLPRLWVTGISDAIVTVSIKAHP